MGLRKFIGIYEIESLQNTLSSKCINQSLKLISYSMVFFVMVTCFAVSSCHGNTKLVAR